MLKIITNNSNLKEKHITILNDDKLPIEGMLTYLYEKKDIKTTKSFFSSLFNFIKKEKTINIKNVKDKYRKESLIIMLHGINSYPDTHMNLSFRNHFTKRGLDFFRYNLYGSVKKKGKSRSLQEASIEMHLSDLDTVLNHFNKLYKNIYLIGHSLGAFTVLMQNSNLVKANILIDPPYALTNNMKLKYSISGVKVTNSSIGSKASVVDWGDGRPFFVSDNISKTALLLKKNTVNEKIENLHKPTLMVKALGSWLDNIAFKKLLKNPNKYVEVKNADHCFSNLNGIDDLINHSENWISNNL